MTENGNRGEVKLGLGGHSYIAQLGNDPPASFAEQCALVARKVRKFHPQLFNHSTTPFGLIAIGRIFCTVHVRPAIPDYPTRRSQQGVP